MDTCPRCRSKNRWMLADKRIKCVECKHRWRPRSVWESIRAPEATKRRLLREFVDSVPCYRGDGEAVMSVPTVAKFYRHARATCALDQGGLRAPLPMTSPVILRIEINDRPRKVSIRPLDGESAKGWSDRAQKSPSCELLSCNDAAAVGALRLQQGKVVLSESTPSSRKVDASHELSRFWRELCSQLKQRRHIPASTLHLHLGEIAFRWNHQPHDISDLLEQSMRALQLSELEPVLVRDR